jgi:hypothetical protein
MTELPETTSRRGLLVGLALGVPVMAYAVRGAVVDEHLTHPFELARWIVGLAVVHDVMLVPVVLAVGIALRRVVPAVAWPPVRAGLLTSAVLCAVAWPFVRGYGRSATIPSLFPRNYATGLLAALAVVWLLVAAWWLIARRRSTSPADRQATAPAHGGQ